MSKTQTSITTFSLPTSICESYACCCFTYFIRYKDKSRIMIWILLPKRRGWHFNPCSQHQQPRSGTQFGVEGHEVRGL
ncbi:hypothetical protein O988_00951 [Pseudogymnoascus sp. VKM F-3808]|nr:hypothetical protein O988_00951 [Pseudogymnoascus sp. VKM F-3808]